MFLTPDEIATLTDYHLPAKQREWLTVHGWAFEVGASGKPKVSRTYAEQKMGVITQQEEPDFSFLGKAA